MLNRTMPNMTIPVGRPRRRGNPFGHDAFQQALKVHRPSIAQAQQHQRRGDAAEVRAEGDRKVDAALNMATIMARASTPNSGNWKAICWMLVLLRNFEGCRMARAANTTMKAMM